jgi:hypothetical protein
MPGGDVEPVGRFGPDLPRVTAEMSEVFVLAGWGPSASGRRRPAALEPSPERGGGRAAILLTALTAGAVGFGAGALVTRTPRAPVLADANPRAASQPQPPSPATPPTVLAEAAPAPAVEVPPAAAPAVPKASAERAKAPTKAHARLRKKSQGLGETRAASARPSIRVAASRPVAQPASCERDAQGEDCRRAVTEADLHLREVYQSAVRRGVSQGVLVDYRSRWASVRDRDSADPARLIEGYGALAYDLGRENAR